MTPCSCGSNEAHQIAKRRTADNIGLILWSDGCVTANLGRGIRGIGAPRSDIERRKAVEAGWLVMGEAGVYDYNEIARLVLVARRAVHQRMLPALDFMRRTMAGRTVRRGGRHGAVILTSKPRAHHHSCPCATCGGRNLPPGWIPGPVKFAQ